MNWFCGAAAGMCGSGILYKLFFCFRCRNKVNGFSMFVLFMDAPLVSHNIEAICTTFMLMPHLFYVSY